MAEENENVEKLGAMVKRGADIPATNAIGLASGIMQNGRELTASEALWRQNRASSTADYNTRKAEHAMRKADNSSDPREIALSRGMAGVYAGRAAKASDLASDLQEQRAENAIDNMRGLYAPIKFAVGGGQGEDGAFNSLISAARDGGSKAINDFRSALKDKREKGLVVKPATKTAPKVPSANPVVASADTTDIDMNSAIEGYMSGEDDDLFGLA